MRLALHPDVFGQSRRSGVAGVHLRSDSVQTIGLEGEVEQTSHGFGGESPAAVLGVEHPADLGDLALTVGQPQRDVADGNRLVFHHQRQSPRFAVQVGSFHAFLDALGGVCNRPGRFQEVTGDIGAGVDAVQPVHVRQLVQPQSQSRSVGRQPRRGRDRRRLGIREPADVMHGVDRFARGRGAGAAPSFGEGRAVEDPLGHVVFDDRARSQAAQAAGPGELGGQLEGRGGQTGAAGAWVQPEPDLRGVADEVVDHQAAGELVGSGVGDGQHRQVSAVQTLPDGSVDHGRHGRRRVMRLGQMSVCLHRRVRGSLRVCGGICLAERADAGSIVAQRKQVRCQHGPKLTVHADTEAIVCTRVVVLGTLDSLC